MVLPEQAMAVVPVAPVALPVLLYIIAALWLAPALAFTVNPVAL